jgi:hypothetical protein
MRSIYFFIVSLATVSLAAPSTTVNERDAYSWSAPLARFYQEVDKRIQDARRSPDYPNPPACDMSKAVLPVAPIPLPSPDADTHLHHVAIGRGIQVCIFNSSIFQFMYNLLMNPRTTPAQIRLQLLSRLAQLPPFTTPLAQKATTPRSRP